jgi:hypothetical protein
MLIGAATVHDVVIKLSNVVFFFSTIIPSYHGSFPARNIISSRASVGFNVHVFKNRANSKEDVVVRGIEDSQAPAEGREEVDKRK